MRTLWICLVALGAASSFPAMARETREQRGEAELAKELSGLVPEKSVRCLSSSSIEGSRIIEGTAFVYRAHGGKIYVNRPIGAQMLHDDDILVQYVFGSELCRNDRVKLLDRGSRMEHGFVRLGDFTSYTKPK